MSRLFIVRHAEAQKNLEKMHGGGTQELTQEGLKQATQVAETFMEIVRKPIVVCQPEKRSYYTAKFIADRLNKPVHLAENLSGVGLGVIADLNEDELAKQYPQVAEALTKWRSGKALLKDYPDVPGREHMNDFALRIKKVLIELITQDSYADFIVVGTTSTINMMNHLMQQQWNFVREKYDFIPFPFTGINGWEISQSLKCRKIFSNF